MGHELASHGYDHTRVDRLSPASFREDVRRTKGTIEEIAGCRVIGYRAPTFSIGSDTPWAYEILENEDYHYSSSIYQFATIFMARPMHHAAPFNLDLDAFGVSTNNAPPVGAEFPVRWRGYFDSFLIGRLGEICTTSTRPMNSLVFSIFILGKSTPDSHASQGSGCEAACAITRTSKQCRHGSRGLCRISVGVGWTKCSRIA
jgi:hypothetical protein